MLIQILESHDSEALVDADSEALLTLIQMLILSALILKHLLMTQRLMCLLILKQC